MQGDREKLTNQTGPNRCNIVVFWAPDINSWKIQSAHTTKWYIRTFCAVFCISVTVVTKQNKKSEENGTWIKKYKDLMCCSCSKAHFVFDDLLDLFSHIHHLNVFLFCFNIQTQWMKSGHGNIKYQSKVKMKGRWNTSFA